MTIARTVALLFTALSMVPLATSYLHGEPPAPAPKGKKIALVVGINEYKNRKLDDLKYAEADATELADALKKNGFEVRVLLGSDAGKEAATRENILAAVKDALRGVGKRDTVLIAFAGHGLQVFVKNKDQPGERVVPFFCPVDAVPSDEKTLISLSDVLTELDERGGGVNMLLVDACRNLADPTRGVRGGSTAIRRKNSNRGPPHSFRAPAASARGRRRKPVTGTGCSSISSLRV